MLLQCGTTCWQAKALADVGHGSLLRSAAVQFGPSCLLTGDNSDSFQALKDSLQISQMNPVHSSPSFPSQTSQQIAEFFLNRSCFQRLGCRLGGVKMCEPCEDERNFSLSRDPMMPQCFRPFGNVRVKISDPLAGSGRISEGKNLWWLEETKRSAGAPKPIRAVAWSSHVQLRQASALCQHPDKCRRQVFVGVRLLHFTAFHHVSPYVTHISHLGNPANIFVPVPSIDRYGTLTAGHKA